MENRISFCTEENEAIINIRLVSLEFYIQNYSTSIQNIRNAFQLEHVNRELPPGREYIQFHFQKHLSGNSGEKFSLQRKLQKQKDLIFNALKKTLIVKGVEKV